MKVCASLIVFASLGIFAAACLLAAPDGPDRAITAAARAAEKEGGGPPPLVVDKSAPLLLAEPPERDPLEPPQGPVADNGPCYVCHANYEEEEFAQYHAEANVGCMKCHGKSMAHRDDEDNITPPDKMFWPERIESNCEECHDEHDVPAVEVVTRFQECCPAKTDPESIVCTDCHGRHRLKIRTVRWNKETSELIVRKIEE